MAEDLRRELLKGVTEVLLLAVLADGPAYGYGLARTIDERSGGYFTLSQGTLYPALARLQAAGLIVGEWRPGASPGKPRRYYALTEAGHRELAGRLDVWAGFAAAVDHVLFRAQH